jgi:hypothetical protein
MPSRVLSSYCNDSKNRHGELAFMPPSKALQPTSLPPLRVAKVADEFVR